MQMIPNVIQGHPQMAGDIGIEHAPISIIGQLMASSKNSKRDWSHIENRIVA